MNRYFWVAALSVSFAIFAGGYSAGRFFAPLRVIEKTDTTAQARIRELTEQVASLSKRVHRVKVAVVKPDGSKTTTTTTDAQSEATTETKEDLSERVTTHEHKEREEVSAATWFLGATVLARPQTFNASNPLGMIDAGAVFGRRFGSLALGLSVTVPVQKPVSFPTLGLSATVGF